MNLPSVFNDLLNIPQFVSWTLTNDGKKIPLNPNNGKPAKANDTSTWSDYSKATQINGNIGIELGLGLGGIDIDDCIQPDGTLSEMARDILNIMNTYTESSPSGKGLHLLFKYEGFIAFDNGKLGRRDNSLGLELYVGQHFLTITGKPFGEIKTIATRTDEIFRVYEKYLKKQEEITPTININVETKEPHSITEPEKTDNSEPKQEISYDTKRLWTVMFRAVNGAEIKKLHDGDISKYPSQSEADMALANFLAFWCKCDKSLMLAMFNETALSHREKWKERKDYREWTINEAVAGIHRIRNKAFFLYEHSCEAYRNPFLGNAFKGRIPDVGQFYSLKQHNHNLIVPFHDVVTGNFQTLLSVEPNGNITPYEGLYISGSDFVIRAERKPNTDTAFVTLDLLSAIAISDDTDRLNDVYCVLINNNLVTVCKAIRSRYRLIKIVPDNKEEASKKAAYWCKSQGLADKVIPPQPNMADWFCAYITERTGD